MQARTTYEIKAYAMAKKGFGAKDICEILNYNNRDCFTTTGGGVSLVVPTGKPGHCQLQMVITGNQILEGNREGQRSVEAA